SYWQSISYLGLGPSAHSFNVDSRKWNVANNALYIKNMENSVPYHEIEQLSEYDKINELIMTRMRTKWGLNLTLLRNQFEGALMGKFQKNMENTIVQEMCEI